MMKITPVLEVWEIRSEIYTQAKWDLLQRPSDPEAPSQPTRCLQ